ncbi:hypothetical protein EPO15_10260 [bacterium]|nr:MAG: hypothetical protein EPO15_10260 [bacterium]
MSFKALGVFRELQNSPGRESDDALILKEVLEQLEVLGVKTTAVTPEELDGLPLSGYDVVIPMCEAPARIARLDAEARRGAAALWVNPPSAVLACYRTAMVPRLAAEPGVVQPVAEVRETAGGPGPAPEFPAPHGWWAKRGDVHNTCDRDVVRVPAWGDAPAVLADFASRGIRHWVLQAHVPGDLVKFYGVGPGRWFTWFYHDPVRARRTPFDLDALAEQAARGARALGLEVFGGDAIIREDGSPAVIDLNSWPSFARVRRGAAVQISWHLQRRLKALTRTP